MVMLRQLLVGTAVSVCNIAINALVMATVVQIFFRRLLAQSGKRLSGLSFEIGVRIKAREVL